MRTAKVLSVIRLGFRPNDTSSDPVYKVITDLPKGQVNAFYMKIVDKKQQPIKSAFDHVPTPGVINPEEINEGDDIIFDKQDGFSKVVRWKGRAIRQKGYSFDEYAPLC